MPSSRTLTSTVSAAHWMATVIGVFGGEYLAALDSKLRSTCARRSASQRPSRAASPGISTVTRLAMWCKRRFANGQSAGIKVVHVRRLPQLVPVLARTTLTAIVLG